MAQDDLGIWSPPGGAKTARFEEPDGNTLSLTQFEPQRERLLRHEHLGVDAEAAGDVLAVRRIRLEEVA